MLVLLLVLLLALLLVLLLVLAPSAIANCFLIRYAILMRVTIIIEISKIVYDSLTRFIIASVFTIMKSPDIIASSISL